HTAKVTRVALSADGTRIVSGSADGTVRIWDTATGQTTRVLKRNDLAANTGGVTCLALSADGKRIVSGNCDILGEGITVFDADTGRKVVAIRGISGTSSVALSTDAKRIAAAAFDGSVELWDADTGAKLRTLRPPGKSPAPNVAEHAIA